MESHTVHRKLVFSLLLGCALCSAPAVAVESGSGQSARVSGGASVPLQASARTPQQWAALRPGYRNLRPKMRGTFD